MLLVALVLLSALCPTIRYRTTNATNTTHNVNTTDNTRENILKLFTTDNTSDPRTKNRLGQREGLSSRSEEG